jgi:intracellular septation protein
MKVFLEYIPLILFLLLYKLEPRVVELGGIELGVGGIYSATGMLMISTVLVYGFYFLKEKSLSRMQWIVVGAVLLFGTTTLLLRSEDILKWKAPAVNWLIGLIFLGSQFFAKKNMAQSMFGHVVNMPDARWKRLNLGWALTFFVVGTANLFVAFRFHEYWVDFKVFGSFGMLLIATVAQIVYIYPYLEQEDAVADVDTRGNSNDSA